MHLALSLFDQVNRDVPDSGKGFVVASAQHLMVAESLDQEAARDCFLLVRMWLTTSAIRTRPARLSWREAEFRSRDLTLSQENWSSMKKMGMSETTVAEDDFESVLVSAPNHLLTTLLHLLFSCNSLYSTSLSYFHFHFLRFQLCCLSSAFTFNLLIILKGDVAP